MYIEDSRGMSTTFVVRESRMYDPRYVDEVFSRNDGAYLNLVSCSAHSCRELRNSYYNQNMIRQAQANDFDSICFILDQLSLQTQKLNDLAYRLQVQQQGFVMPVVLTKDEFQKQLQNTFLVYEFDGKIVGFLRIDEEQEAGAEDFIDWLKPEYKEAYISHAHRCIGKLAVLPSTGRIGIATTLFTK